MNLKEALEIVANEAEISALGERTDEHLRILKAVEVVNAFYEQYGSFFAEFNKDYVASKVIKKSNDTY
tara:strand:- start:948 stop:1151 length:204 start_codon:yes stop_codon:yes gene_type:complete